MGRLTEKLPVELSGDEMEVDFNLRFMQDVLGNVPTQRVVPKLTGPESAVTVTMADREDFIYVLMPLKKAGRGMMTEEMKLRPPSH